MWHSGGLVLVLVLAACAQQLPHQRGKNWLRMRLVKSTDGAPAATVTFRQSHPADGMDSSSIQSSGRRVVTTSEGSVGNWNAWPWRTLVVSKLPSARGAGGAGVQLLPVTARPSTSRRECQSAVDASANSAISTSRPNMLINARHLVRMRVTRVKVKVATSTYQYSTTSTCKSSTRRRTVFFSTFNLDLIVV